MTTNNRLPGLPSVPRIRTSYYCACGCGRLTQKSFTPGHDARLKGLIMRLVHGVMTMEEIKEWAGDRGEQTATAITKAMKDKNLMKRWNIVIPAKEEQKAG